MSTRLDTVVGCLALTLMSMGADESVLDLAEPARA